MTSLCPTSSTSYFFGTFSPSRRQNGCGRTWHMRAIDSTLIQGQYQLASLSIGLAPSPPHRLVLAHTESLARP